METNKFEEIARSKFEEREIQPSAASWSKLDAMLENASPSKKNNGINWFAIAAVFIGFVVIASFVFNETEFSSSSDLVNEGSTNEVLKNEKEFYNIQQKELLGNQNQQGVVVTSATNEEKNSIVGEIKKSLKSNDVQTKNERVVSTNPTKKNTKTSIILIKNSKETIASTKALNDTSVEKELENESNRQFANPNSSNQLIQNPKQVETVAITDIDLLLKNAQEKIAKQRVASSEKVDAIALLGDVEIEMQQTLQDKFFYALGEGFDYVKTSFVDRRN